SIGREINQEAMVLLALELIDDFGETVTSHPLGDTRIIKDPDILWTADVILAVAEPSSRPRIGRRWIDDFSIGRVPCCRNDRLRCDTDTCFHPTAVLAEVALRAVRGKGPEKLSGRRIMDGLWRLLPTDDGESASARRVNLRHRRRVAEAGLGFTRQSVDEL